MSAAGQTYAEIAQLLNRSPDFESSDTTERPAATAFLGRRCRDAPRTQQGSACPAVARSAFKNRLRFQINKSRSYCSCEIRQAALPPPFLRTSRKRSPFSLRIDEATRTTSPRPPASPLPPPPPTETAPRNPPDARAPRPGAVVQQRTHTCTCSEAIESGQGKGMRRHLEAHGV